MADPRERLDTARLERALTAAAVRPGGVRVLGSVDSTNDELRRWAEAGAGDWALVTAETQSGGRGRRGRSWASPPAGNLYLSLLSPELAAPEQWPRLPVLAAVAGAEALAAEGIAVGLKWPNDLIGPSGGKLGGILVETRGAGRPRAVIGIGLNVNARTADLVPGAASLLLEDGALRDRHELGARLVAALQEWWGVLNDRGFEPVARAWRERALWLGELVRVAEEAGETVGELAGIDEWGRLRLVTADGERRLAAGEVSLRREE